VRGNHARGRAPPRWTCVPCPYADGKVPEHSLLILSTPLGSPSSFSLLCCVRRSTPAMDGQVELAATPSSLLRVSSALASYALVFLTLRRSFPPRAACLLPSGHRWRAVPPRPLARTWPSPPPSIVSQAMDACRFVSSRGASLAPSPASLATSVLLNLAAALPLRHRSWPSRHEQAPAALSLSVDACRLPSASPPLSRHRHSLPSPEMASLRVPPL
jgi:hypothetical protein